MTQTEAQRKIDTIAKRFKQNKEDQVKFVFASSILILADTEFFKEWINRTADARILEKAYKEKGLFTGEQRRFLFRDCLKSAYAGGAFELYELYLAFADDLEPLKEIVAAYTEPTRRSKTFSPGLNELALRILGRASSDAGDFVEYCCGDATALSDAYMRGLAQHYYGQDRDDFKTDIIAALKRKALHAEDAMTITNGDDINPKTQTWELEVVGKLQQDASKGWWTQSGIIMSMQNLKVIEDAYNKMAKIKDTNSSYDQVYVKVDDLKNVGDVEEAIHDLGFQSTWSSNQQREDMQKQVFRSQMIFGGVAAVSLLVAAINIINTMTMAIYERTREIGVMKVLGCEINNIRTMFLMESSCIGFIGGVLGVLISLLVSFILNNLTTIMASFGQYIDLSGIMGGYGASSSTISIIPPWLMLGALVFATLIGLVSGILPANKAVKISALEAIRHD